MYENVGCDDYTQYVLLDTLCVAVPGRDRTLFCGVFHRFIAFEALCHRTSVKSGAHICYIDL